VRVERDIFLTIFLATFGTAYCIRMRVMRKCVERPCEE